MLIHEEPVTGRALSGHTGRVPPSHEEAREREKEREEKKKVTEEKKEDKVTRGTETMSS